MEDIRNIISFIKELERLKINTRTAWTSTGRHESIADHNLDTKNGSVEN
jgi:putative hydrolases of HD superfamily